MVTFVTFLFATYIGQRKNGHICDHFINNQESHYEYRIIHYQK